MKTLGAIGEFGWIRRAEKFCRGIGDDAAVLPGPRKDLLLTTDMILEGRHFRLKQATAFEIGWKAMAVNLSDIAAMGGIPRSAVVSLGAPARTRAAFLDRLYRGMRAAARRFGVSIVGGDTNASARLVLAVTVLGEVEKGRAVHRSGARTRDWVFVTGSLGGSYGSKKHLRFVPRVAEARWLARYFRPHAMMDLSDGLASDIRRICEQSGVGVRIDRSAVPVSRHARSLRGALCDGEDFELLFTLAPADGRRLLRAKKPKGFPKFTKVGEITQAWHGDRLAWKGFDHFR